MSPEGKKLLAICLFLSLLLASGLVAIKVVGEAHVPTKKGTILSIGPSNFTAGDSLHPLTATLTDADGYPVWGREIVWSATLGILSPSTEEITNSFGQITVEYWPSLVDFETSTRIIAEFVGDESYEGSQGIADVTIVPGIPPPRPDTGKSEGVNFEPYVSTFHLLFEDRWRNLLGNLTGELRITEPEKEIIRSVCKLSLSSPRPDESHEPYIDKVELFTAWMCSIYPGYPISIGAAPLSQNVTLHVDEDVILFEESRNVSGFGEELWMVFGFSSGSKTRPTIRVYFSDGQKWEWKHKYDVTSHFMLWSGIKGAYLSELSGKVETETITLRTPMTEKINPPRTDQ